MSSVKGPLRQAALSRRAAVPALDRTAFAHRLATLGPRLVHEFAPANAGLVVSLYAAIGDEPDLMPLAEALHSAGVVLCLPVTGGRDAALVFRRWAPGDAMQVGQRGIAEPRPGAPALDPDVLFLPLAAFDRRGHRLGYGAGHYDRSLAGLRARKAVRAIGVAYAVQEQLYIPDDEHDQTLDLVVTDRDVVLCGA